MERILNESRELSRHVPWRRWMAMGVAAIPVVWLASAAYLAPAQAATLPEPLAMSVAEQGRIPDRAARAAALARVRAVDAKIVKFKEENRGKLPDQIQSTLAQLQSVRARLGNADEQLASLQRRKIGSEMQLLITRMNYYLALRGNPGIRSVERQLAATEAEHARATETLSQAHPRIKQLEAALTALRAQLAVMRQAGTANSELSELYSETEQNTLKTAIQNLDLEIEEKLRLVRSLNANIASLSSRIEALPKLEKCYAELLSEREHALEELERASTAGPSPLPR